MSSNIRVKEKWFKQKMRILPKYVFIGQSGTNLFFFDIELFLENR
jgi:hypothetical protein